MHQISRKSITLNWKLFEIQVMTKMFQRKYYRLI